MLLLIRCLTLFQDIAIESVDAFPGVSTVIIRLLLLLLLSLLLFALLHVPPDLEVKQLLVGIQQIVPGTRIYQVQFVYPIEFVVVFEVVRQNTATLRILQQIF